MTKQCKKKPKKTRQWNKPKKQEQHKKTRQWNKPKKQEQHKNSMQEETSFLPLETTNRKRFFIHLITT
jgi:hypothetical protein